MSSRELRQQLVAISFIPSGDIHKQVVVISEFATPALQARKDGSDGHRETVIPIETSSRGEQSPTWRSQEEGTNNATFDK